MNKHYSILLISALIFSGSLYATQDKVLSAVLSDKNWNGEKIPDGQQCQKFKGLGSTPRIRVNNIPEGANAIVIEYSDKTYKAMDNGGHGKIGYFIDERMDEVTVPPLLGHTFDLPKSFFVVAPQQAPKWDKAGAYLPPCSGGKGNLYVAKIKAVHVEGGEISKEITETEVKLGVY